MRVVNIRYQMKVNLGNYESADFAAEGIVDEGESLPAATDKLRRYVDWYARYQSRELKAKEYRKQLIELDKVDSDFARSEYTRIENWLNAYETRKAEMEAL